MLENWLMTIIFVSSLPRWRYDLANVSYLPNYCEPNWKFRSSFAPGKFLISLLGMMTPALSLPIRGQYPGHLITLSQSEASIQVTWSLRGGGQMNSKSHTQGRAAIYFWAIDWCWRCRDKKCVDLSCNHHQQPAGTSSARLFICPLKERESSSDSLRDAMIRRQTDLIWSI